MRVKGIVALAALMTAAPLAAHTVWLQPEGTAGTWRVLFGGHAGKLESYEPAKLGPVTAYDARGARLKVTRTVRDDGVRVTVAGRPSVIAASFDNGIWTKVASGPSVNLPMNKVAGAISATNALKHHKTIVAWTPAALRPVGQKMEVIPLAAPQPGEPLRFVVRIDGRPAPGVRYGRGEDTGDGVTDARGQGAIAVSKGFNKLWAGRRSRVKGDPRLTELSYEYLLGFNA